ncbi:UNVERIFIED_ORG: hypothetical protein HNP28_000996 [Comamonas terrigena]
MDKINERYGKATVHIASTGRTQEDEDGWRMKQERRTPRYKTKLNEIPIARLRAGFFNASAVFKK